MSKESIFGHKNAMVEIKLNLSPWTSFSIYISLTYEKSYENIISDLMKDWYLSHGVCFTSAYRYCWTRILAIWLAKINLRYNLTTRIFMDMEFAKKNSALVAL